jgi:hypothetical protein
VHSTSIVHTLITPIYEFSPNYCFSFLELSTFTPNTLLSPNFTLYCLRNKLHPLTNIKKIYHKKILIYTPGPVGNGQVTCVSMYTNSFDSDYGDGPGAAVWVDTLGDLFFLFYILYFFIVIL